MTRPIYELEFRGEKFRFFQTPSAEATIKEIFSDCYKIFEPEIPFDTGDVILDIGANEGMFSIMMAKLFPQVKVFSFEPITRTFNHLLDNIKLNEILTIHPENIGVGKSKMDLTMNISRDFSGGSSAVIGFNPKDHIQQITKIVSLDEVFDIFRIEKVKLLKIDCEGMEYDVLYPSSKLDKIEYLAGECHHNARLSFENRHPHMLITWLSDRVKLRGIEVCQMAD